MGVFKSIWDNPYLRFILLLGLLAAVFFLIRDLRQVLTAFLIAYLLAYLLNPFVNFTEKRANRALGVALVVVILLSLLVLLWLLGIQVAAQFSTFSVKLPRLFENLQELPFLIGRWVDPQYGATFDQVYVNFVRLSRFLMTELAPRLLSVGTDGRNPTEALFTVAGGGAQVGIIMVLTLYLSYNFAGYTRSFLRSFPHRHRPLVETLVSTAGESVGSYVRGQIVIALAVGLLSFIGFSLVGVPLALALGVLAGLFNLIPFLGPILTAVPTLLLAFTEGTNQVIGASIVLLLVNQIDAHLLTPIVFSRVISLDPVTIIVVVLIGASLFGFVGAVLAVPVAAFLKVIYKKYYLGSAWYKRAK